MIERIRSQNIELSVNPIAMHRVIENLMIEGSDLIKGECSVCLAPFTAQCQVVPLKCNPEHVFHKECLLSWANHNYTCPICRQPVIEAAAHIAMYEMVN